MLNKRLVAMYKTGETSYLDFLLSSASLVDFISSYYLVSEVADYDTKLLEQIEAHRQKIENEKKELEADKQKLSSSKTTLISKQKATEVIKKSKEQYAEKLSDDEKKLQQEIEELTAHEKSINQEIAKMKAAYNAEQARLAAQKASATTLSDSAASSYGFGWPVANHYIGTYYGVAGRYWSLGYHTGIDFPVGSGTAVYSVGDGQVVDTGRSSAYGNYVEIYHGNNIYSFYAHGSSVIVSKGQYVSKGQQIMYSGATGNVTGPHLHFEIRTPGSGFYNCVNPRPYLPQ